MIFDYFGNLEDWACENGYDPYELYGEKVLIEKRSSLVEFHLHQGKTDTYAKFEGYKDYDNGWWDIKLVQEGLYRKEKPVIVTEIIYV